MSDSPLENAVGTFTLESRDDGEILFEVSPGATEREYVDYAEEDGLAVLVLGYPYRTGPRWVSARELLAELQSGEPRMDNIHGFFTIVVNDLWSGSQSIITDRFGGYGAFISAGNGRVIVSDSIERISSKLPSLHLDATGMLEFLELGFTLGDTTQFSEIKRLATSTITRIAAGAVLSKRKYWDYMADGKGEYRSYAVEEIFTRHILDAFQCCDKVALPLTGGLDSRTILSACLPPDGRLNCFTLGNAWNDDSRVAMHVCKALCISHSLYAADSGSMKRALDAIPRLASESNGMLNFLLLAPMFEAYESVAGTCDVLLTGVGGEMVRGCLVLGNEPAPSTVSEVVPAMLRRISLNRTEGLLKSPDGQSSGAVVTRAFELWLESLGTSDPIGAMECFYLENRVANFTACSVRPAGKNMKLWDPWLYTPILEAARYVPVAEKSSDIIHRNIVMQNNTVLGQLLLSTGAMVPHKTRSAHLVARSLGRKAGLLSVKAANKTIRAASGREFHRPNYVRDYAYLFSRYGGGLVRERLRPEKMMLSGLVSPDELQIAVERFLEGDSRQFYVLANLLCSELWLEQVARRTHLVFG